MIRLGVGDPGPRAMSAGAGRLAVGPREHVVQFYGDDGELAECVGAYLAEGLESR